MQTQKIKLNHGQKSCLIEFKEYDKLYVLKEYLSQVFKLARFRLYYKEKDTEVYIESEKQYMDMVNSGDVQELFLIEDNQKDKNYFDFFMQQLFTNNVCCENDWSGCVICQEKKQVKPEEFNQLVKECLYELINKEDFQAFCKKQFKRTIQDVDLFLELFSKLSKPIKQIITIQPSQQQQLQIYQNQQISAIRQTNTPVQSQFYKQNIMNKSINIHRQSELQQQMPKSQYLPQGSSQIRSSIIPGPPPEYSVRYEKREDKIQEFNADAYVKIEITIINNGQKRWPDGVYIKQVGHYPQNYQYVPSLNSNDKRSLSLQFQTPINAGTYTFTWVLFYKDETDSEKRIGSRCITEFKVKDLSRAQKAQKCVDMISNRIFQNKGKKEIRNHVDDCMQKYPEMGIQQIINMVSEELDKQTDSYAQFSQYFSEDVMNNVLIDDSDKIKDLTDRLKDSLKSKTNNTILLYGQEGFGRKSAIRKAIDNCEQDLQMKSKKIIKIFVNAYLHKSEGNILSAINNQLLQTAQIKSKINKLSVDELMKHFKQYENAFHGIVLVIERVEILATVKKQFFLYSILEWIRESKYPIIFVGITSDLLFQEKLEKRVKSRFQNIPYFFMELDFQFVQKVLLTRLEQIDRNQVINIYENYILSKSFEEYFAKLQSLQVSISKLIYLFRSSFFLAGSRFNRPDKKMIDSFKFERNVSAEPISLQELMQQSLKWIYPNVKLENGKLLSQPEYVILFSFYNLIMHQKPQIMFDDIIQHSKKTMQTYKLQHHKTASEFTPLVLNKALDNLIKQKFISLQQQSKNLENNQIILCMSIDDLKNLFENIRYDLPDFMSYLYNFNF